jgi:hypothetical protein
MKGGHKKCSQNPFIEDIFVYPQEVTGSTVSTDQEEYSKWLYGLDDETFGKIRLQSHSHVNMGVTPSSVDDRHREQILAQLDPEMFYIFMIWNKSLSVHALIYDMQNNILYEDKDVEVKLISDDGTDEFLSEAKAKVRKRRTKKPTANSNKSQKNITQLELETDFSDFEEYADFPFSGADFGHFREQFHLGKDIWKR